MSKQNWTMFCSLSAELLAGVGLLLLLFFDYSSTFTLCCCCQVNRGSSASVSIIRLLKLSNLQVLRCCWESPAQMEIKSEQRAACKREQRCWDKMLWIIQGRCCCWGPERADTLSGAPHISCFIPAVSLLVLLLYNQTFCLSFISIYCVSMWSLFFK